MAAPPLAHAGQPLGPIRPTFTGVLAFLAGCTAFQTLEVLGEVNLAELVLPVVAVVAICMRDGRAAFSLKPFRVLLVALLVTFLGYVLTDLSRDSTADQYLRGWGRVGLTLFDFVVLSVIAAQDRRNLWWWAAGFGTGAVLYFRFVLKMPLPVWKHGYAEFFTVGFCAFAYFLPARVAAVGFAILGLMSIHWDFRVHGLVCFAIAAALWLRGAALQPTRRRRRIWPLVIALLVAGSVAQLVTRATEDQYNRLRREQSDAGRLNGLRFAATAFLQSPMIGYGSWGTSPELDHAYRSATQGTGGNAVVVTGRASTALAHSQLLQSLIEAGILGGVFFATLGVMLARRLGHVALHRPLDAITPFLLYYTFYGLWHLLMSPFAAPHRLQIAAGAVVIVVLALEARLATRRVAQQRPVAPPPVAAAPLAPRPAPAGSPSGATAPMPETPPASATDPLVHAPIIGRNPFRPPGPITS